MPDGSAADRTDTLFDGRLRLHQPATGHRAGTDAVLLAAAAPDCSGLIFDLGAGVGTIGLALAQRRPQARVRLVECQDDLVALAARNIAENALGARVFVVQADILSPSSRHAAGLASEPADLVVTNPPFFEAGTVRPSPQAGKAIAHVATRTNDSTGIDAWMRAAVALLAPRGAIALIHRADRLHDVLGACHGRLGDIRVRPVHPHVDAPASRILVVARKGSRAPPSLLPALVLHDADGRFTPQAEAIHRGLAGLDGVAFQ